MAHLADEPAVPRPARRARAGAGGRAAAREHAKAPYSPAEIGGYLARADAQATVAGRMRASGLVCLGAGAGLIRTVSAGEVVFLPRGNVRRFRNPGIQPAASRLQIYLLEQSLTGGILHLP